MSDDKEKKLRGYLYGEIDRLKMYISEMYDDHYMELKTWTWKCGQMGNEIGSLRKQLAEKHNLQHAYDRLQQKLSAKKAELRKVNADLEQAQCENSKLKQRLEEKEQEYELILGALRMQIHQDERETEHQVAVTKVENDLQLENRSISTELLDLTSDVADITIENEIEFHDCGQINELEVDNIVKTYYSSGSEVDVEKKVSEPIYTTELAPDVRENVPGNITEEDDSVENITEQEDSFENMKEQRDDDTKQKAKYQFWYALKKRVSIKGKQAKPTPLTPKFGTNN